MDRENRCKKLIIEKFGAKYLNIKPNKWDFCVYYTKLFNAFSQIKQGKIKYNDSLDLYVKLIYEDFNPKYFFEKYNLYEDENAANLAVKQNNLNVIQYLLNKEIFPSPSVMKASLIQGSLNLAQIYNRFNIIPNVEILNRIAEAGKLDKIKFWAAARQLTPSMDGITLAAMNNHNDIVTYSFENNIPNDPYLLTYHAIKNDNAQLIQTITNFTGPNIYVYLVWNLSEFINIRNRGNFLDNRFIKNISDILGPINGYVSGIYKYTITDEIINYYIANNTQQMQISRMQIIKDLKIALMREDNILLNILAKYKIYPSFEDSFEVYISYQGPRKFLQQIYGNIFIDMIKARIDPKNIFISYQLTHDLLNNMKKYKPYFLRLPNANDINTINNNINNYINSDIIQHLENF